MKYIKNLEDKTQSVIAESLADDAAELAGLDADVVDAAVKELDFAGYLELGNAVETDDADRIREILNVSDVVPQEPISGEIDLEEDTIAQHDEWSGQDEQQEALNLIDAAVERLGDFYTADDVIEKIRTGYSGYNPMVIGRAIQIIKQESGLEEDDEHPEDQFPHDPTMLCSNCGGSGYDPYGNTCGTCGGKGRLTLDGDYIDDDAFEQAYGYDDILDEAGYIKGRAPNKSKNYIRKGGNKQQFKWRIELNNGKVLLRWADTRYNATHGQISPEQHIIGVKSVKRIKNVAEAWPNKPKDPWMPDTPIPDRLYKKTAKYPKGKINKQSREYKDWLQSEKDKLKEADNPSAPAAAPAPTAATPPSAGSTIDALAQPADTAVDQDNENVPQSRKEIDDLQIGDEIEVADIDGQPAAGRVRNLAGPGDTLVITGKGNEEHMIRKDSILSTPLIPVQEKQQSRLDKTNLGKKNKRAERVEKKKQMDIYEIDTDAMREAYEKALDEDTQASPIKALRTILQDAGIETGRGYNDKNVGNRKIRIYINRGYSKLTKLEAIVQAGMEKAGYQVRKVRAYAGMKKNDPNYFPGASRDSRMYPNVAVWLEGNPVGSRYQTELDETEGSGITVKRLPDAKGTYTDQIRFEMGPLDEWSFQDRNFQVARELEKIKQEDPELRRRLKTQHGSWAFAKTPGRGDPMGIIYINVAKEDGLNEVAPPGMESWIKKRKPEFKKRYGAKWEEVLYATAWKQKNNESIEEGKLRKMGPEKTAIIVANAALRVAQWIKKDNADLDPNDIDDAISLETVQGDVQTFSKISKLIRAGKSKAAANIFDNLDSIIEEELQAVLSDTTLRTIDRFIKAHGGDGFYRINVYDESLEEGENRIDHREIIAMIAPHASADDMAEDLLPLIEYAFDDLEIEFDADLANKVLMDMGREPIAESKWDYKKRDKGKGAGTDSPMYDGGAKNRKNRKAFRKAEKAKAHAARMRGEVDEEFEHYGSGADFIPVKFNGREIGTVWQEGEGDWHAEFNKTGSSWGMIDSYIDAVNLLRDEAGLDPIDEDVGDNHQKKIAIDTVKNPSKGLLSGPSAKEAEATLRNKFGYDDKKIAKLKEGLQFFVDPIGGGRFDVRNDNGDLHDTYEDGEEAVRVAKELNAQYGEIDETMFDTEGRQLKIGHTVFDSKGQSGEVIKFTDQSYKGNRVAVIKYYGASGGDGGREYFYKSVDENNIQLDEDLERIKELAGINEVKSGNFKSKMIGQRVKIMTVDAFGNDHIGEEGVVHRASREHTFSQMVPFIVEYGVELDSGERISIRRESVHKIKQVTEMRRGNETNAEEMRRLKRELRNLEINDKSGKSYLRHEIRKLQGEIDLRKERAVKETASGGGTGAGAIASSPTAIGGMQSRNQSIYGQTKLKKKPVPKKRPTKEASDGIGRNKKD